MLVRYTTSASLLILIPYLRLLEKLAVASDKEKPKPKRDEIIKRLDFLIREMNNDRHDGYVKQAYRVDLLEIRDYIIEALDK